MMAKITGQGLASIAIVVAVLWACLIGERMISHSAAAVTVQTLQAMRTLRMKNRRLPAATPSRALPRRPRAELG